MLKVFHTSAANSAACGYRTCAAGWVTRPGTVTWFPICEGKTLGWGEGVVLMFLSCLSLSESILIRKKKKIPCFKSILPLTVIGK